MDKKASVCIGITSDDYPLNKHVGKEHRSYGYYSEEGQKWRNGDHLEKYGQSYTSGDVVGCGINTFTREIFFTKNGIYQGVAYWDVPDTVPLYPTVSLRGAVGLTCVATFQGPFKFDLHALPDISPSMWSESLGDPTLSDEQILYPPSSANVSASRLQQQQQSQRELRGLHSWHGNDVAIWLESIGYGQYRKEFFANNISGRHLYSLSQPLLKDELKVESYGHRADILDRVHKLLATLKEKAGSDVDSTNSSIMEYTTDYASSVSDFDYQDSHPLDTSLHNGNEEVLQPHKNQPSRHHHVHHHNHHHFSDHENSEDEGASRANRAKNRNSGLNGIPNSSGLSNAHAAQIASTHTNAIANSHSGNNAPSSTSNPSLSTQGGSSLNLDKNDSRWRRHTVPCPDVSEVLKPSEIFTRFSL